MPKINVAFIKLVENAILPSRAHDNDTGYDIYAVESVLIPANSSALVNTGIQVAHVEPGYWFHIMPRSGLGFKHGIQPHLGVIDEGYRGPMGVKLYNFSNRDYVVSIGDRVAQLIFYPRIDVDFQWQSNISQSDRGATGFGNSGK